MTEPMFAQNLPGLGRHYVHPATGEVWPSVTNVISLGVAKPALQGWAAKQASLAAFDSLPAMVAALSTPACGAKKVAERCGVCRECVRAEIQARHRIVSEEAADRGSDTHQIARREALGLPVEDYDPKLHNLVGLVKKFWSDFGIDLGRDVVLSEATVYNRTAGYAGTLDLVARIGEGFVIRRFMGYEPVGGKRRAVFEDVPMAPGLWLIDYKTSQSNQAVYAESGLQLAGLANAEMVLFDTGAEAKFELPEPLAGWAICKLVDMPVDAPFYKLVDMPMGGSKEDAFTAFQHVLGTANWLIGQHGVKESIITKGNL